MKIAHDAAVQDFETFQDSCDSTMNTFGELESDVAVFLGSEQAEKQALLAALHTAKMAVHDMRIDEQDAFVDNLDRDFQNTQVGQPLSFCCQMQKKNPGQCVGHIR